MSLSQRNYRACPSRILRPKVVASLYFPHVCALWRPGTYKPLLTAPNTSGLRVSDTEYDLAARRQACFYSATPETDQATVAGRAISHNIFSLDVFHVPTGVEVSDGWYLLFLTPGDNYGRFFVIHGAPQSEQAGPRHPITVQQIYGRNIPATQLPPTIQATLTEVMA